MWFESSVRLPCGFRIGGCGSPSGVVGFHWAGAQEGALGVGAGPHPAKRSHPSRSRPAGHVGPSGPRPHSHRSLSGVPLQGHRRRGQTGLCRGERSPPTAQSTRRQERPAAAILGVLPGQGPLLPGYAAKARGQSPQTLRWKEVSGAGRRATGGGVGVQSRALCSVDPGRRRGKPGREAWEAAEAREGLGAAGGVAGTGQSRL